MRRQGLLRPNDARGGRHRPPRLFLPSVIKEAARMPVAAERLGRRALLQACVGAFALFALFLLPANAADLASIVRSLGQGGYEETAKHIGQLAATGDSAAAPVLQALSDGNLYVRTEDGVVFVATETDDGFTLADPLTGAAAGTATSDEVEKI